jgi:hypothetical protein
MAAVTATTNPVILTEDFKSEAYDARLQWAFPPASQSNKQQGGLVVQTAGETGVHQQT